ncbi:MAG: pyridoxal phosphate-dependent aminotransferase family protein [Candidatus Bipolaricaulota bacterium]
MNDLFAKCRAFAADPALAQSMGYPTNPRRAKELGLYPFFVPLDETEGTEVSVAGRRLLMLGSNNYLGLTMHPEVREAAVRATQKFGTSCTGSRFLNGTLALHEELERRLAAFVGKPRALVFSTGYQANLGVLSSLLGRNDVAVCDKEDHASIVDGCRLAMGRMVRYRHNDLDDLDRVLSACPRVAAKLVVVDGVFSMGGEIAPLPDILPVCRKHEARLLVDDAHAVGVLGEGRGTAAHYGVADDVDLIVGTFSKSLASIGGFVAGDEEPIEWIQHLARSLIFSASLPAPNVAAALAALAVLEREPDRVLRVNALADRVRDELRTLGFDVGESRTPIVPIFIGDAMDALKAWRTLFDAGVYVNVAIPPAVPSGKALLRTSYMATHSEAQIDRALEIFARVGRSLGLLG